MAAKTLPPIDLLRECFSYNQATGLLWWKHRPISHFKHKWDCHAFNKKYADKPATYTAGNGYIYVTVNYSRYLAHRVIWKMVHGKEPSKHIDHINGDPLDNRISNLREATQSQNLCNHAGQRRSKTGLKGASPRSDNPNIFVAQIRINGKQTRIGQFKTAEEAHAAYCKAAKELHGEFANFG